MENYSYEKDKDIFSQGNPNDQDSDNSASTNDACFDEPNNNVEYTDDALEYVLKIPDEYKMAGRTFKLLAIGSGTVYTYDDLDSTDSTITFATQRPNTAYALIYK